MPGERTVPECVDCAAAVPLFTAHCPGCGAEATGSTVGPCGDCGAAVDHTEPGSCPECQAPISPWDLVTERVVAAGFHVEVPVSDAVSHPVAAGFAPGRGKPAGQRADYRRPLPDGSEIHVREYDDCYGVHRDRRSAENRLGHLTRDVPLETAAGATALSLLFLGARRLPLPTPPVLPALLAVRAAPRVPRRLLGRLAGRVPWPPLARSR